MYTMTVYCANTDECASSNDLKIEDEDMGDGAEHEVKCESCGKTTVFDICYMPYPDNERLRVE